MPAPASPRILTVYYSRTGTTGKVAQILSAAVRSDVEMIADRASRAGPLGLLRSSFEAVLRRTPRLGPAIYDPSRYDLVVIGTPTWSDSMSSPVRSYLRANRRSLPAVAFFATCGGAGSQRPFQQMAAEAGKSPVATLIVRQAALPTSHDAIRAFARQLELALAVARPLEAQLLGGADLARRPR